MASCCICCSVFKSNNVLTITGCGHVFHQACIHTWLSTGNSLNNQTCPNCRRPVARGLLRRLHLNFEEEMTQNISIINELQKSNISMGNELQKMKCQLAAVEKEKSLLLKSKIIYQQDAAKLREENNKLKETNEDLKKKLDEEYETSELYERKYLTLEYEKRGLELVW